MCGSWLLSTKERQNHPLQLPAHSLCLFLHALVETACLPRRKHQGINIGLPADCNGVSQLFSNLFYRGYNAGLESALTWQVGQGCIQHQFKCSQRSPPGPKILGGEFGAHGFAEIAIYLLGADGMTFAIIIEILKKVLAPQLLAIAYDFHDTPIINHDLMFDTALAPESQQYASPADESKMTFA